MPERRERPVEARNAEPPFVLALDLGTSSLRAALYDRHVHVVSGTAARVEYSQELTDAGGVSYPVAGLDALVDAVLDAAQAGAAAAGIRAAQVRAVGIACFFHSLVGVDRAESAVTPVISWADTTAADAATVLREGVDADAVWNETGCPIHPSYWPARVAHLRTATPEVVVWVGYPELLLQRLTGRRAMSTSMASGTGMLDRRHDTWHDEVLSATGTDVTALPPIVADDEPVGTLTADAAARWPLFGAATWYPAWGDGLTGNVGLGCRDARRAALMIGTSGAIRTIVPGREAAPPRGLFAYRSGRRETLLGGALSEGGGVIAWLAGATRRSISTLDAEAATLAPDGHGLTVLPLLTGERSPGYRGDARGAIIGLSLTTTPADLHRAFLESIAYRFALLDGLLLSVTGGHAITAGGGALSRSALWPRILADVLGRPVELTRVQEASLRGAGVLALEAAGLATPHGPDAARLRASITIEPDPVAHERYREAMARQRGLYQALLGEAPNAAGGDPSAA